MTLREELEDVFRRSLVLDDLSLTDDTTAEDVEEWDSIAHVTLMFAIEQEFGIEFHGEEFARFTNVGDLRRALEVKLAQRAQGN